MEKKFLEKLIGQQSKIISKEPGEKKVKVISGSIENVDYTEGFIFVDADHPGPLVDLFWMVGSLQLQSTYKMNTDYFYLAWGIAEEGYVTVDTDDHWLTAFSFQFTVGDNIGLDIGASFLKTQNFRVHWTIWPPGFVVSGAIQFIGDFFLVVMLNSAWYPLIID